MSENHEPKKGWQNLELRHSSISIIDGDRGVNYPTQSEFSPSGFCLFLNTGNIKDDTFDFTDCAFISETKDALLRKGRISRGDIVLTTRGTVGSVAFYHESVPFDVIRINSGMVILRCHEGLVARYVYQLFKSGVMKSQMALYSSGSAQPQLPIKDLRRIQLPTAPPETQRKIAAVLAAYDDLIEANRRRIALLERMAEEIYREWFVRLRFPGHEKTKITKGVPAGWEPKPSNELFNLMSGGTPDTDNPAYWDGDIPFFTPKDASENCYVLGTEKTLTEKGLESCNSPLFPKHTLFITARGTVGKLALAHRPMAMNQSCYALSPKMSGPVFWHYLALRNAIVYVKGVAQSGVFDNIVLDTFKVVPIFWPGETLVHEFNKVAVPMFEQVGVLLESNTHLQRTRDLLLPRLISGKLPVEDLPIAFPPSMAEAAKA